MTAFQLCALFAITLFVGFIYWLGYRGGVIEGHAKGSDERLGVQQSQKALIAQLRTSLMRMNGEHRKLYWLYERAVDASKFGDGERSILLAIAKQLQLSAETFKALGAIDQEKRTLELRADVLSMATLLSREIQDSGTAQRSLSEAAPQPACTPQAHGTRLTARPLDLELRHA